MSNYGWIITKDLLSEEFGDRCECGTTGPSTISNKMQKVVRDGLVAILISPDFGAGWYTWSSKMDESMLFDPDLVAAVEANDHALMGKIAAEKWPGEYAGGLRDLEIIWLPEGTRFAITEYDGNESITTVPNLDLEA
jgi:hypothetical protein